MESTMLVGVAAIILFVTVDALPETHHLIQTDHQGHRVPMDVTYDSDENTVLVVVGDVSRYRGGAQTVNLHDFNSGYGVLKDINRKTCLLGRAPSPKARPEIYRAGVTDNVEDHWLDINPARMTQESITAVAGERIASFCSDYATYFVTASPLRKEKRDTRSTTTYWCVASSCIYDTNQYESLV